VAFCRIHDGEIRSREPVMEPDAVIIQDPTLLHSVNVFEGLPPDGYVLLNTSQDLESLGIADFTDRFPAGHVQTVPATELALQHVGRPIPNAALLGSFAAATGIIGLSSVEAAIRQKFPTEIAEKNIAAATAAYEAVPGRAERRDKEALPC
jgi:pyruvate ferredoxin oxidoreductase gamma subunit